MRDPNDIFNMSILREKITDLPTLNVSKTKGNSMTRYDFQCPKCHLAYEVGLKMSDLGKKDVECPKCKTRMEQKILNPRRVMVYG